MEGQLTIFDWQQMKEDIRRKLQETEEKIKEITGNFVYIGYRLRQIEKEEIYILDGASSIYEFAEKEYGLTRTATLRYMAINAKFSIEGNSTELLPQYKEFGNSKLQEMLNLSDEDCELLTAKATVKEIRDLKAFNRQQALEESEDTQEARQEERREVSYTNLQKCIIDFFSSKEKRDTLNAVMKMALENDPAEEITRQQTELINPSEFASHTKGVIYLFMYEYDRGVAYKSLISNIITKLSWQEFVAEIAQIYSDSYGPDTWCNFYGPVVDTVEVKKEEKTPEKPENTKSEACATSHKKEDIIPMGTTNLKDIVTGNLTRPTEEEIQEWREKNSREEEAEDEEEVQGYGETETDGAEQEEYTTEYADNEPEGTCEPAQAEPYEGTVIENPYFTLQKEAKELSDKISHTMHMYERMIVEKEAMDKVIDNVHRLAAVVEQMTELGEESYNE